MAAKKMESSFINMVIVLSAIALISGLALGYTYNMTKPSIDKMKKEKKENAIKNVLPEFDKLNEMQVVDEMELYPAYKGGKHVGTAVKAFTKTGFNGKIELMVGISADGTVCNVEVLYQGETPGLGTEMVKDEFKNQLNKKKIKENFSVTKDGGEVEAITAATISSRAFCDAVNNGVKAYKKLMKKEGVK